MRMCSPRIEPVNNKVVFVEIKRQGARGEGNRVCQQSSGKIVLEPCSEMHDLRVNRPAKYEVCNSEAGNIHFIDHHEGQNKQVVNAGQVKPTSGFRLIDEETICYCRNDDGEEKAYQERKRRKVSSVLKPRA